MKKFCLIALFLALFASASHGQSSTTASLNIDQYDWNKLIVTHSFDKKNGISVQFWFKQPTDAKRFRVFYQRKQTFGGEKDKFQTTLTAGLGLQGTSRKRSSISYQFIVPTDISLKYKIGKNWSFNARSGNTFSFSPTAKQGDHTWKNVNQAGFKFKKTFLFYNNENLTGFKAGLRENFQGGGITYDVNKKFTLGTTIYTDMKDRDKKARFAITAGFKF